MSVGIAGSVGTGGGGGGSVTVSGFVPSYVAGAPATATLVIASGTGVQRVAIPTGAETIRVTWFGYGPFRYRLGNGSVVATSSDAPAIPGEKFLLPVGTNTHFAVYGEASGKAVLEGGSGGFG